MTAAPWFVVQSEPLREAAASASLRRSGFETYLPRFQDRYRIAPLFPSYLFVASAERWYPIQKSMGVRHLLMAGDRPALLADQVITDIRRRERNGLVKLPPAPTYRKGARVHIIRGPFENRFAIYVGMSGPQRERVLIQLLGQYVSIDLPARNLAPP
jgi:transcriptional antiterminator RfaH